MKAPLFIGHDLGTSGDKAVLVSREGAVLASATAGYPLTHPGPDRAEQAPSDWWAAVCETTRRVVEISGVDPSEVVALCFAGQMLALVPLDAEARPTRPAISWMDARATRQAERIIRRFGGARVVSALAGATPTGKDLVAKIAWLAEHEPAVFEATVAFCDATGYLVARATGALRIDPTAAGGTGLFSPGRRRWSRLLARLTGFPLTKMPEVVESTAVAGGLTAVAASELGLMEGTPVAMGMADIPAAAVGSGAVRSGDGHAYLGTSGWIGVTVGSPKSVPKSGIASVPAADRRNCLLIGESETAGACRDWLARILGLDHGALEGLAEQCEPGAAGR